MLIVNKEQLTGRLEVRVGTAGIETGTATVRYDDDDDDDDTDDGDEQIVFSGDGLGKIGLVVRPRSIERKKGTVEVEIIDISEKKQTKKKEEDQQKKRLNFQNPSLTSS